MAVPTGWFSRIVLPVRFRFVGSSLTLVTSTAKGASTNRPPRSVLLTRIDSLLIVSKSNGAFERTWLPEIVKSGLLESPVPETNEYTNSVSVRVSVSVVERVPSTVPIGEFSAIERLEIRTEVGDSLTLVIEIGNSRSKINPPASWVWMRTE